MHCKYIYPAGVQATLQANILADIVAMATGETNVNNLSASCDKINTVITSTVAAGWTLHDASAATNGKTIKSPLADDAATYKYCQINTNTASSIYLLLYETWDASAHTGTYQAYSSTQYPQQFSTSGGTLYIEITPRMIMIHSLYATTWGSSSYAGGSLIAERSRDCPWDTVSAGWPPYISTNLGLLLSADTGTTVPRKLTRSGSTITGSTATMTGYVFPFGSINSALTNMSGADQKVQTPSSGNVIPLWPIVFCDTGSMPQQYGNISSISDIWVVPQGVAANLDTITVSGNTYIVYQEYNTTRLIAVKYG